MIGKFLQIKGKIRINNKITQLVFNIPYCNIANFHIFSHYCYYLFYGWEHGMIIAH